MAYRIFFRQGNLLDAAAADFIVNPSNTLLQLGSGVSGAFARACGKALQAEMARALQKTGILKKGDVVLTGGGECRHFRAVLHAAVMDYNLGAAHTAPTLGDIETILSNIERHLQRSQTAKTPSLLLPLMGTGVGGLCKHDVICLYRDFFRRESAIDCDVILYAHTHNDLALMKKCFEG